MPDRMLEIAPDLSLPVDAVTETFLIFGKRGSGKTSTASVLTEELIGAGLPVAVIDPMGAWWGLRSSADGQGPGLPVTILGGEHADIPLGPQSGTTAADLVVSERLPVVLDLFLMSKTQQRKFVTDFMERLFRKNREPLHLVVDEADRFAPQRGAGGEEARLLGAYEDIVLRGRKPGIGSTSITLRPAQLHSAIRSQVEVLIAMRLLGKLDVAAIDEWIRLHASDEDARELKASLPSLPTGDAWVWSPGWLEMMRRVHVRPRRTFDSSATPKVGEQLAVPRQFARLDAPGLERMAALLGAGAEPEAPARPGVRKSGVQDAGAAALRRQVSDLTAALAEARARPPERVEVPVLAPGEIAAIEQVIAEVKGIAASIELALGRAAAPPKPAPAREPHLRAAAPKSVPAAAQVPSAGSGPVALGKAHRAVLAALARFPEGRDKRSAAMLAGYSPKAGHFSNTLGDLRRGGLIEPGMPLKITQAGIAALGDSFEPPPEGPALIGYWMAQLGKAEREVLRALLDAYPDELTKQELGERTGYSPGAGHFGNALGRLRTLQLISGSAAGMTADETLAREARAVPETGGTGA